MTNDPNDILWRRLSKALFSVQKTSDEGIFIARVMEQIRALQPVLPDLAWHRFLRWTVPVLGAGLASLLLAISSAPAISAQSLDTFLFQEQAADEDPLSPLLEAFQ